MSTVHQFRVASVLIFNRRCECAGELATLSASPSAPDAQRALPETLRTALDLAPDAPMESLWSALWSTHPGLLGIRRNRKVDEIEKAREKQHVAGMTPDERRNFKHEQQEQAFRAELAEIEQLLRTAPQRWGHVEQAIGREHLAGLGLPPVTTMSAGTPAVPTGLSGLERAIAAHQREVASRRSS